MSNDYEILIAAPHAPSAAAKVVVEGLQELGFTAVPDSDDKVWFSARRFPKSLPGNPLDWLREQVLALPWPASTGVDEHLTVLWQDDHTMEDDSMAGRTSPYRWRQEAWVVRGKR